MYFLGASSRGHLAPEGWLLAPAPHLAVTRLAAGWSNLVSGPGTLETVCQQTREKSTPFMTSSQSRKVPLPASPMTSLPASPIASLPASRLRHFRLPYSVTAGLPSASLLASPINGNGPQSAGFKGRSHRPPPPVRRRVRDFWTGFIVPPGRPCVKNTTMPHSSAVSPWHNVSHS